MIGFLAVGALAFSLSAGQPGRLWNGAGEDWEMLKDYIPKSNGRWEDWNGLQNVKHRWNDYRKGDFDWSFVLGSLWGGWDLEGWQDDDGTAWKFDLGFILKSKNEDAAAEFLTKLFEKHAKEDGEEADRFKANLEFLAGLAHQTGELTQDQINQAKAIVFHIAAAKVAFEKSLIDIFLKLERAKLELIKRQLEKAYTIIKCLAHAKWQQIVDAIEAAGKIDVLKDGLGRIGLEALKEAKNGMKNFFKEAIEKAKRFEEHLSKIGECHKGEHEQHGEHLGEKEASIDDEQANGHWEYVPPKPHKPEKPSDSSSSSSSSESKSSEGSH